MQTDRITDRIPIIDVTDLYHPHQDPGDNFDIITAYALPEIDLRAVILDCTDAFRKPVSDHPGLAPDWQDPRGPREPGFIPILQMNYLFDRNVPVATTPFRTMRSPDDAMDDVPAFQEAGIELIKNTLRTSDRRIDILCFSSCRSIAAAFNQEPDLFREKVNRIHLSAGSASAAFREWNVILDPHAYVRLLRSDLPLALYPCATVNGPFTGSRHNTYWSLPNLDFIESMDARLRRYLDYVFSRSGRLDYLRVLDEDAEVTGQISYPRPHHVWETAIWAQVSGRRLVRGADGTHRFLPPSMAGPGDEVFPENLRPCVLDVQDSGVFSFTLTDAPSNVLIYVRGDPCLYEAGYAEALPALYKSFQPKNRVDEH